MNDNDFDVEPETQKPRGNKTILWVVLSFVVAFGAAAAVYFGFFANNTQGEAPTASTKPTSQTENKPLPNAPSAAGEDAEGIGAACRDYLIISGKSIKEPYLNYQELYAAAADKTTDETLKGYFNSIKDNLYNSTDSEEVVNQKTQVYGENVENVINYCVESGAFTLEQYDDYMAEVLTSEGIELPDMSKLEN